MLYAAAAVERAMKIQQVIVRALSGAITWLQAADILGLDPRSVRRRRHSQLNEDIKPRAGRLVSQFESGQRSSRFPLVACSSYGQAL
jgi:hypothetical protein